MDASLAGDGRSYYLEAGSGQRYSLGTFLVTVIAGNEDTSSLMAGCVLVGAKGSVMPIHRHEKTHEVIYVLEGMSSLELDGKHFQLVPGDYVSIPPRTAHAFEFLDYRSRYLIFSFGGNANGLYEKLGEPSVSAQYVEHVESTWVGEAASADTQFLGSKGSQAVYEGEKELVAPAQARPYVLASGEGERMIAGDQLFTFLTDQRQSGGAFIALLTEGPKGHPIPRHLHEKHTEVFYCVGGSMKMIAGEEALSVYPGDFVHVPAGTVHSYQLTAVNTRFIGFLAPGIFEPFFRYLCDPFAGHSVPSVPPPFRFDRVIQHLSELDLKLMERPGGSPPVGDH